MIACRCQAEALGWTDQPPTRRGWYWFKKEVQNGDHVIMMLDIFFKGSMMWGAGLGNLSHVTGEWSGPVFPPPIEQKEPA
jgi:hypothetical protein